MTKTEPKGEAVGRAIRFSDDELVAMIREGVVTDGYRTAGSWLKAQREQGRGSNDRRVRRAWERAIREDAQARKLVEAYEVERKAEQSAAFKARVGSKPNGKTAEAKAADETVADIGRKGDAQKRVAARRTSKPTTASKASSTRKTAAPKAKVTSTGRSRSRSET